jgi:lysophospholipase L1-like esterase
MRALLLYSIYSGELFFVAAVLFLGAVGLDLSGFLTTRPLARRIAAMLALLSIPLAALSGTPLPIFLAIPVLAATLGYAFLGFGAPRRLSRLLGAAAIALSMIAIVVELPYHMTHPPIDRPVGLFVIGDSLASGGFGEALAWPEVLSRESGLPLKNLALPSDTAARAVEDQIPELPPTNGGECVIVEIGGNDMLEGAPAESFASALDELLTKAGASGRRRLIMIELPLPPGQWRYGAIQRRLSAKHGCVLIPKRLLAGVLLREGNTLDGVHMSQRGHVAFARALAAWLGWRPT